MSKVWILKHKGANNIWNLTGYSITSVVNNAMTVDAVHAFLTKKAAQKYMAENGVTHWDILGLELPKSTLDARKTNWGVSNEGHKHVMEMKDNNGKSRFAIGEDGSVELHGCEVTPAEVNTATKQCIEKYKPALEDLGEE